MAGPWYLDQRARGKGPAHFDRHLLIGGSVDQRDGYGRSGERGGIGDGVAFGDLVRPSAHQAANRAPAQVPLGAEPQRGAARQGDHAGGGERSAP